MGRTNYTKNLSTMELTNIENYLNFNKSPSFIATTLNRDESTIRAEIRNYSSFEGNARKCKNCTNYKICKQNFLCDDIVTEGYCNSCKGCKHAINNCSNYHTIVDCSLLKKNHNVCNACPLRQKCKKVKIKYIAKKAIEKHILAKEYSRRNKKITFFKPDFKEYLSTCVKNGISPEVILNTLPEKYVDYKVSVPTLYEYIDSGLLDCCNIDLRNKVKRVKSNNESNKRNTVKNHQLNGRSIEDIPKEERDNPRLGYVEIDTVEGIKGGELLFTIMIPCFSLMLAYKIHSKTQEEIINQLNILENTLGKDFYTIFRKTITDNGCEFLNFEGIEKSVDGFSKRLSLYYTHSYASYEKPHVENNHRLIRWLIEKGYDISKLNANDILNILNRVNNYPRKKLGYKTPIERLEVTMGKDLLNKLCLTKINIKDLNMKKKKL